MCGPFLWGFGWIVPLVGVLMCLGFMLVMFRFAGTGHRSMCMGGRCGGPTDKDADAALPDASR